MRIAVFHIRRVGVWFALLALAAQLLGLPAHGDGAVHLAGGSVRSGEMHHLFFGHDHGDGEIAKTPHGPVHAPHEEQACLLCASSAAGKSHLRVAWRQLVPGARFAALLASSRQPLAASCFDRAVPSRAPPTLGA